MDKKSKILIWVFVVLIVVSVGATFWRIIVKKDYVITAQADCDPYADKCFVWECDPQSTVEGEACTGEAEADIWFYQIINRKAFNIPLCDPNDENCEALTCPEGEADCEVVFCDDTTKEEQGVECNDPVKFTEENPIEEEEIECDSETNAECATEEEEGEVVTEDGGAVQVDGGISAQ